MNVQPAGPATPLLLGEESVVRQPTGSSFGDLLAAALDGTSIALERADARAGAVAAGSGNVVDASIARAKADVALEIAAVAASRISGAVNSLLQTQV